LCFSIAGAGVLLAGSGLWRVVVRIAQGAPIGYILLRLLASGEQPMALKDTIALGMSLPHRSPDPIDEAVVRRVAQRAEALSFGDLWVTDNVVDHAGCFSSLTVLTYAAALTTTIRLGVSVLVLPIQHPVHVAHQAATTDYLSRGRLILGVGIGRDHDFPPFQVPTARKVRRFVESIELMKALWTGSDVTYQGEIYQVENTRIGTKPAQSPHPPIWIGGGHPNAVRRAARLSDGWIGAGGSTTDGFGASVLILRAALEEARRDPSTFPISKRVFLSVHERADVAKAEVNRWFTEVYRNPSLTETGGVYGTPEQVREQLEAIASKGASHLLLNPVARHAEQVEAVAEIVGLT
jgi:probable F420-dependent oxidoreductase